MSATICAGCNIEFKGKGYTIHLKRTGNPPCVAIFRQAEAQGMLDEEHFGTPEEHGLPTGEFRGDLFGEDYEPEDFGYIDDPEPSSPLESDSESDEESDEEEEDDLDGQERADLAQGYEPPRAAREDTPMPAPQENPPLLAAPTRETRKAAEDRFHHKPIIEKYPGGLAGKPTSTARAQTAEQAYESSLTDSTASNPYAPFNSKTDWEAARWAKLRGAGSTAFSDLLNIEGVSSIQGFDFSFLRTYISLQGSRQAGFVLRQLRAAQ
jgi:hypothetical protein